MRTTTKACSASPTTKTGRLFACRHQRSRRARWIVPDLPGSQASPMAAPSRWAALRWWAKTARWHTRPGGTTVIPNNPYADAAAAMASPGSSSFRSKRGDGNGHRNGHRQSQRTRRINSIAAAGAAVKQPGMVTNISSQQRQQAMAQLHTQSGSRIVVETTVIKSVVSVEQLNRATSQPNRPSQRDEGSAQHAGSTRRAGVR